MVRCEQDLCQSSCYVKCYSHETVLKTVLELIGIECIGSQHGNCMKAVTVVALGTL
eukprot:COSAG02_NODE_1318_length_13293_cov_39.414886_10_plen_56_part_00